MKNKIYILHKNGADGHYIALSTLLKEVDVELVYREFSVLGKFFKGLFRLNFRLLAKQIQNLFFLIELLFTKDKKVVFGIAPFDIKLSRIMILLKKHRVYYHTSWTCWDGSFQPKNYHQTYKLMSTWKKFLEDYVEGIFAVSNTSRDELIENYDIDTSKIHVVKHSIDQTQLTYNHLNNSDPKSFICIGRLLPEKGIYELLDYFSKRPELNLSIVGKGKLEKMVKVYAYQFDNINYRGFIKSKKELSLVMNEHTYLILNSKKTKKWEELFGMVLIEGMACGLIPISSDHSGPKEIIKANENGYLFKEGEVVNALDLIVSKSQESIKKEEQVEFSKRFYLDIIKKNWKPILD